MISYPNIRMFVVNSKLMQRKILCFYFLLAPCLSHCQASLEDIPKDNSIVKYELVDTPNVGVTKAGQKIILGGFSGLRFLGKTSEGTLQFLTHTDRGPNPEAYKDKSKTKRPFMLPNFNPRLIILEANPATQKMRIVKQINLKDFDGKLLTGLPQAKNHEYPVDVYGKALEFDKQGMDLEGVDIASDSSYWMIEEYGPSIVHFSARGKLLELFKPGTGLPEIVKQRKLNRGFEGIALQGNKLFAILQSPLTSSERNQQSNVIRIIEFDIKTKKTVGQYLYLLDNKADRIGDMVSLDSQRFLVMEQNNNKGKEIFKKVFLIDLTKATNITSLPKQLVESNLENLELTQFKKMGITAVNKQEILNLATLGIIEEKVEGITLVDPSHIAVIIDNDFALNGILNKKSGQAEFKKEKSVLYLIPLNLDLAI